MGKRELGHIYDDQVVDIPFPKKVRDEIIAADRAEPHHESARRSGIIKWPGGIHPQEEGIRV